MMLKVIRLMQVTSLSHQCLIVFATNSIFWFLVNCNYFSVTFFVEMNLKNISILLKND